MTTAVLGALQSPSGLLDVLVYFAEKDGGSPTKAIADLGMKRATFYACIEKLRVLGFVFERKEPDYPPRAHYGVTRKGRQAAEHLASLAPLVARSVLNLERELEGLRGSKPTDSNLNRTEQVLLALVEHAYVENEWNRALEFANELRLLASGVEDSSPRNSPRSMRTSAPRSSQTTRKGRSRGTNARSVRASSAGSSECSRSSS